MVEDRLLEFPERRRGLQAELLIESFSRRSIGLERVSLATTAL